MLQGSLSHRQKLWRGSRSTSTPRCRICRHTISRWRQSSQQTKAGQTTPLQATQILSPRTRSSAPEPQLALHLADTRAAAHAHADRGYRFDRHTALPLPLRAAQTLPHPSSAPLPGWTPSLHRRPIRHAAPPPPLRSQSLATEPPFVLQPLPDTRWTLSLKLHQRLSHHTTPRPTLRSRSLDPEPHLVLQPLPENPASDHIRVDHGHRFHE